MSGSGKGVSGVVGISQNGSGAGTFPDTSPGIDPTTLPALPSIYGCSLQGKTSQSRPSYAIQWELR